MSGESRMSLERTSRNMAFGAHRPMSSLTDTPSPASPSCASAKSTRGTARNGFSKFEYEAQLN